MSKLQDSYIVVKAAKGSRPKRRLQLPLLVGSSGLCDVVVNASSLAPHAYTLYAEGQGLRLHHQPSGKDVPLSSLAKLGIEVSGPMPGVAASGQGSTRIAREALSLEATLFAKLPQPARKALLGGLSQRARLTVFGLAATIALCVGAFAYTRDGGKSPDLSATPIELTFDVVRADTIGANPKNPDFMKGYERGLTFSLEASEETSTQAALLAFEVAGLNFGRELELSVNERVVFETEAEAACAQQSCPKSVLIEKGLLKPGTNLIRLNHKLPDSSYFLANVHIRPLPHVKPEEVEQAALWLSLAQRAYDERQIVPENLVTADRNAALAQKLTQERDGARDLQARATVLRGEIAKAFDVLTNEIWANVDIVTKLEKHDEAEQALTQLQRMYPDPRSEEHVLIMQRLQELKDAKEQRR